MTRWALVAVVALAACEVPLDPIADSDFAYSVQGYLDVSADTQWVRVERVAETAEIAPTPLDVAVTLAGAGLDGALAQHVRTFGTGPAHLFWTTAPIAPGQTYRLTARGPDGTTATDIRVPDPGAFAVTVEDGPFVCPTRVTVTGAAFVADVQTRYTVRRGGALEAYRFTHAAARETAADGSLAYKVYPGDDFRAMDLDGLAFPDGLQRVEIAVAVGTADWPETAGRTLEDVLYYTSPLVTGGLGFVGGAVTATRPFQPGVLLFGPFETRPCTVGNASG